MSPGRTAVSHGTPFHVRRGTPARLLPARASSAGSQYLRYDDAIVTVGPDGPHSCSVRVEDLAAGYSHGAFIFLGPGFYPGSPAHGSGGSTGGPGGAK